MKTRLSLHLAEIAEKSSCEDNLTHELVYFWPIEITFNNTYNDVIIMLRTVITPMMDIEMREELIWMN